MQYAALEQKSPQAEIEASSRFSLGVVVPGVLALWLAVYLTSGFLPLSWFDFADFQIAMQAPLAIGPFRPNVEVRGKPFTGNEASWGNLPPTEHLGAAAFTTDNLGFRYTPPVRPGQPPRVVVFGGFSFTWGYGLADWETFPAQLSRQLGVNVYNAGQFFPQQSLNTFDRLLHDIHAAPDLAVYLMTEGTRYEPIRDPVLNRFSERVKFQLRRVKYVLGSWLSASPLQAECIRINQWLENDIVLPNHYRARIKQLSLPRGHKMVVRKGDFDALLNDTPAAPVETADYIAWWSKRLAERHIDLLVLLVPEKLDVYGVALGLKLPAVTYNTRLARELMKRGIDVIDPLPGLRQSARSELASDKLMYYREDEHWNASGAKRLAGMTAERIAARGDFVLGAGR